MTLIQAKNIGIYNAVSRDDSIVRYLVHIYIADLLLDQEPWINVTWACSVKANTVRTTDGGWDSVMTRARAGGVTKGKDHGGTDLTDDDFVNGDEHGKQLGMDYSEISKKFVNSSTGINDSLERQPYVKPAKKMSALYSKYVGRYGNLAYGNITIYVEANNATGGNRDPVLLMLRYGPTAKWRLEAVGLIHVFKAHGQEPFWHWRMFVWFDVNTTMASHVTVVFDAEIPPVFTRDLALTDAAWSTP